MLFIKSIHSYFSSIYRRKKFDTGKLVIKYFPDGLEYFKDPETGNLYDFTGQLLAIPESEEDYKTRVAGYEKYRWLEGTFVNKLSF